MRILQEHVEFIEYEPVKKEIAQAEEAEKKKVRIDELVVIFTSVENGDDEQVARRAVEGAKEFLQRLGVNRILIYPYAHLSQDLAKPSTALDVLRKMESFARESGIETHRSPFGWNKAFQIKVRGHPLAEQSRVYSLAQARAPSFQEPSPGMVYWHDKGVKLKNILTGFIRAELAKRDYIEIITPALANTVLWRVSGHSEHYRDNMFLTNLGDEE
ncbi:MAG: threonine--tRNA ligase, partial [Thaumarchaeota archaeon]|nr:threonine--tRNA ligase [Nitrososphaerota archaeon]